jgi:hypothetical protein
MSAGADVNAPVRTRAVAAPTYLPKEELFEQEHVKNSGQKLLIADEEVQRYYNGMLGFDMQKALDNFVLNTHKQCFTKDARYTLEVHQEGDYNSLRIRTNGRQRTVPVNNFALYTGVLRFDMGALKEGRRRMGVGSAREVPAKFVYKDEEKHKTLYQKELGKQGEKPGVARYSNDRFPLRELQPGQRNQWEDGADESVLGAKLLNEKCWVQHYLIIDGVLDADNNNPCTQMSMANHQCLSAKCELYPGLARIGEPEYYLQLNLLQPKREHANDLIPFADGEEITFDYGGSHVVFNPRYEETHTDFFPGLWANDSRRSWICAKDETYCKCSDCAKPVDYWTSPAMYRTFLQGKCIDKIEEVMRFGNFKSLLDARAAMDRSIVRIQDIVLPAAKKVHARDASEAGASGAVHEWPDNILPEYRKREETIRTAVRKCIQFLQAAGKNPSECAFCSYVSKEEQRQGINHITAKTSISYYFITPEESIEQSIAKIPETCVVLVAGNLQPDKAKGLPDKVKVVVRNRSARKWEGFQLKQKFDTQTGLDILVRDDLADAPWPAK